MKIRKETTQQDEVVATPQTPVEPSEVEVPREAPATSASPVYDTPLVSTRASRTWVKILPSLVILAVIITFVLQNLKNSKVTFITFSGQLPLAVALLGAAALGALVVLTLGSVRIFQLRKAVKQNKLNHRH